MSWAFSLDRAIQSAGAGGTAEAGWATDAVAVLIMTARVGKTTDRKRRVTTALILSTS
jgi:hypothetical protein